MGIERPTGTDIQQCIRMDSKQLAERRASDPICRMEDGRTSGEELKLAVERGLNTHEKRAIAKHVWSKVDELLAALEAVKKTPNGLKTDVDYAAVIKDEVLEGLQEKGWTQSGIVFESIIDAGLKLTPYGRSETFNDKGYDELVKTKT